MDTFAYMKKIEPVLGIGNRSDSKRRSKGLSKAFNSPDCATFYPDRKRTVFPEPVQPPSTRVPDNPVRIE